MTAWLMSSYVSFVSHRTTGNLISHVLFVLGYPVCECDVLYWESWVQIKFCFSLETHHASCMRAVKRGEFVHIKYFFFSSSNSTTTKTARDREANERGNRIKSVNLWCILTSHRPLESARWFIPHLKGKQSRFLRFFSYYLLPPLSMFFSLASHVVCTILIS